MLIVACATPRRGLRGRGHGRGRLAQGALREDALALFAPERVLRSLARGCLLVQRALEVWAAGSAASPEERQQQCRDRPRRRVSTSFCVYTRSRGGASSELAALMDSGDAWRARARLGEAERRRRRLVGRARSGVADTKVVWLFALAIRAEERARGAAGTEAERSTFRPRSWKAGAQGSRLVNSVSGAGASPVGTCLGFFTALGKS